MLKIYLLIYFLFYLLVAFVIPSYRTFKMTGINPITFGKSDNAHDYIGKVMKCLVLFLTIAILLFAFSAKTYEYLVPFLLLESTKVTNLGLVLIHIALIWISLAQFQMQESWRIGIDE